MLTLCISWGKEAGKRFAGTVQNLNCLLSRAPFHHTRTLQSRRHVYGSSTRGNYVYIHFVQFPVKHDPMGPQGLPLKGGAWYDQAAFAQLSFPTESDAVAAQHCAAIKEWAAPVRRTIFVIANPRSGKGKGARVAAVIESQLRFTRHDVTVQMTKSPGEATAIAKNLLIDDDSIVATVGGDGTMCEALEGLFQRNDKDTRPFTVCYVPAGSSNAVAHMTGHADPVTATWSLLKGDSRPMDLMEFKQEDRVRYGALSVTSGLVSDIDIDSEMCRCCGPTRFTLYAVMKIFCCCVCCKCCFPVHANLKYPMRIHYVTSDNPKPSGAWDINDSSQGWETWEGDTQFFHLLTAPSIDQTVKLAPTCRVDDGKLYLGWMTPIGRTSIVDEFDKFEDGIHLEGEKWTEKVVQAVYVQPRRKDVKVVLDGESCSPSVPFMASVLPKRVNVVVGSGSLPAFSNPQQA